MSLIDQGEQAALQMTQRVAEKGVQISIQMVNNTWQHVGQALNTGIKLIQRARHERLTEGKISVKQLNKLTGTTGSVNQVEVPDYAVRAVAKELQQRGVTFAVERTPDNHHFVHFTAPNLASVEHGITVARQRLTPEATISQTKTGPAQETPGRESPKVTRDELNRDVAQAREARKNAPQADNPVAKRGSLRR